MYDLMKPNDVDWLTPDEVERARLQVHELRPHWRPFGPSGVNSYTLGRATYLSPKFDRTITEDNEFMHHHFDWLFDKAMSKVKEVLNIDNISIAENVTTPGFHIFTGPMGKMDIPHYHIDNTINHIIPDAPDDGWMHSFSCLLENISDPPAHLDYKYEGKYHKQFYQIGKMNFWNAYMPHKIGGVNSVRDNEYRISFQGHIAKIDGEYKVYF